MGSMTEKHIDTVNKKNWRDVVLVFRFSSLKSWRSIQTGLSRMLNVHRELTPLAADSRFMVCR